jgi:hypothetical protein
VSDPDPLTQLRTDLDRLDGTPVSAQADVFERVNAAIARELAELDEV